MLKLLIITLMLTLSTPSQAQFAQGFAPKKQLQAPKQEVITPYKGSIKILAMVNDDIITTEDINNRVRAFVMNTKIPYNHQTKNLILDKVMQNTIDEKLKSQEAKRRNISIGQEEIDDAILRYASNANTSYEQIKKDLKSNNIPEEVFVEQITSDIAWIRTVRQNTAQQLVSPSEVEDVLHQIKQDSNKKKYVLSEIIIAKETNKNINELVQTLKEDSRFDLYAAKFSISPSSSNGGDLGLVNAENLNPAIKNGISKLSEGEISNPILIDNNYHIIKVTKIFDPKEKDITLPSKFKIEAMLKNQKTEQEAAKLLQGLRKKATIEVRQ